MTKGQLIQNTPFMGQAINPLTKEVVHVHDFVGTFNVVDTKTDHSLGSVVVTRVNNNKRKFCFPALDHEVYIQEYPEKMCGIGAGCWLSSMAMACILTQQPHLVAGKRILEMGCGIGLPSLTLSTLGSNAPTTVVASDYLETLGCAFSENICINNEHVHALCEFQCIDWNECCLPDYKVQKNFDVIIATDCIYKSTAHIFKTAVIKHLKAKGKLIFINPVETSRPGVNDFIYTLAELGDVEVHHIEVHMNQLYATPMMFVELTMP